MDTHVEFYHSGKYLGPSTSAMEGLTAETCSLDSSRQTTYIQLLPLADGDSLTQPAFGNLTTSSATAPNAVLNTTKASTVDSVVTTHEAVPKYTNSSAMVVVVPSSSNIVTSVPQARLLLSPTVSAAGDTILDSTPIMHSEGATNEVNSTTSGFDDVHDCYASSSDIAARRAAGSPSFDTEAELEAPAIGPKTAVGIATVPISPAPVRSSDQRTQRRWKRKSLRRSNANDGSVEASPMGGWPKGKRRRTRHPRLNEPTPPATAYVIYSRERRPLLRIEYPESSNAELTRILGNEWTRLSKIDKQKYSQKAKQDLERYKRELTEYQQSPEYQTFARLKCDAKCNHSTVIPSAPSHQAAVRSRRENQGLHCTDCDMYFVSEHNKSEHLRSQNHLRRTVGEFEKYLSVVRPNSSYSASSRLEDGAWNHAGTRIPDPLDMDEVIAQVFVKHHERDLELSVLARIAAETTSDIAIKTIEAAKLTARHEAMSRDLVQVKLQRVVCKQQLTNLRAIPMLFETEDYLT